MAGPQSSGTAQDLNDGRSQALQALLTSLTPSAEGSQGREKLSPEQVKKLSERLEQILGDADAGTQPTVNDSGELLNDEGLPVIEISEPAVDSGNGSEAAVAALNKHELPQLAALSPAQRAVRRAHRDRILDLLEAEEQAQAEQDAERERQQKLSALEKRREAARAEVQRLQAARDMQKRMGRALLQNIADAREREERQRAADVAPALNAESAPASKKSVTFADPPRDGEEDKTNLQKKQSSVDWGDVSVAPLRGAFRRQLVDKSTMNSQPMRMDVVERRTGGSSVVEISHGDSDDESVPEDQQDSDTDSDEEEAMFESERREDSTDEDEQSDKQADTDEEFDLSLAQHQREVALEYHRLRGAIGADVARTINTETVREDDVWDQPEVPIEATLSSRPAKPPISRFKASRQAPPSTSISASVLPIGQSQSLRRAVRSGKLKEGKLVGDEGDSASDDDQSRIKEMLDLLRKGDITNVGPLETDSTPVVTVGSIASPPPDSHTFDSSASRLDLPRTAISGSSTKIPAPPSPSSTPSDSLYNSSSVPPVRPTIAGRSSPIVDGSGKNDMKGLKQSIRPFKKPATVIAPPSRHVSGHTGVDDGTRTAQAMIIDSPSFPRPTAIPSALPQDADTPKLRAHAVMVADVQESQRKASHSKDTVPDGGHKRVSRFKAERS